MTLSSRWRRAAAAAVAAATMVPFAATATAAPDRTATTTKYQRSDFLQRALGVPANTVIESVTYDRFQNLLRHTGNFALLIGDPATDTTFAARAVAVDAAARAAGVQKVYWFNPNLTGGAKIGAGTVPNLDIRDSGAIKLVSRLAQQVQGRVAEPRRPVAGQRRHRDRRPTPALQSQAVVTTVGQPTATTNDSVDPIYDYSTGATPANVTDSYFLVYNTDAKSGAAADKVVSWVNLTDDAAAATKVAAAIAGKPFARVEQFAWWQEEANERQRVGTQSTPSQNPEVPVLTDADNVAADGGWRVNQITYPELIDLLDHSTDADAVILFGGTWCPNTRAVLPFINKDAQKNNVTVYNFDTVLDGGKVAATRPVAPTRCRRATGTATLTREGNRTFPSYVYGELVSQYLGNFATEYLPTATNAITYFPFGDTTKPATSKARLQVPYLFGYKGKAGTEPKDGVTRQWIQKNANGTNTEYMSNWYFTNPQPNRVNIPFPSTVPAWQKVNAALNGFDWQTDVSKIIPSRSVYTDTAEYLIDRDGDRRHQRPGRRDGHLRWADGHQPAGAHRRARGPRRERADDPRHGADRVAREQDRPEPDHARRRLGHGRYSQGQHRDGVRLAHDPEQPRRWRRRQARAGRVLRRPAGRRRLHPHGHRSGRDRRHPVDDQPRDRQRVRPQAGRQRRADGQAGRRDRRHGVRPRSPTTRSRSRSRTWARARTSTRSPTPVTTSSRRSPRPAR